MWAGAGDAQGNGAWSTTHCARILRCSDARRRTLQHKLTPLKTTKSPPDTQRQCAECAADIGRERGADRRFVKAHHYCQMCHLVRHARPMQRSRARSFALRFEHRFAASKWHMHVHRPRTAAGAQLFGEDQVSIRYHMLSTTYQDGRMKVGRLRSHGNARRFWGPDAHALGLTHARWGKRVEVHFNLVVLL